MLSFRRNRLFKLFFYENIIFKSYNNLSAHCEIYILQKKPPQLIEAVLNSHLAIY